jgi:hypothetical protein
MAIRRGSHARVRRSTANVRRTWVGAAETGGSRGASAGNRARVYAASNSGSDNFSDQPSAPFRLTLNPIKPVNRNISE